MNDKEITPQQAIDKFLKVLRDPESKKYKFLLINPSNSNERCALGHLYHALGVNNDANGWSVVNLLLGDGQGCFTRDIKYKGEFFKTLSCLNDGTDIQLFELADIVEREWKSGNLFPFAERGTQNA